MGDFAPAFQLIQFDAVRCQPTAVRLGFGQLFFQFSVVVDFAFLGIYQQYFTRLQASLFFDVSRFEIHHAHFAGNYHHVVVRNQIACRTQSVTVEHTASKTSVAEQQGGGAIPRFHQDGVVFIECFQVFADGVLFIERFRHQHGHGVRQAEA